eukprot:SAG31_NODE_5479_length_2515_cov_5.563328_4_plen_114_part_00
MYLAEPEDGLARAARLGAVDALHAEPLEDAGMVLATPPVVPRNRGVDSVPRRRVEHRAVRVSLGGAQDEEGTEAQQHRAGLGRGGGQLRGRGLLHCRPPRGLRPGSARGRKFS